MFSMSTPFHHLGGSPHGITTHGMYNLSLTVTLEYMYIYEF
ncbi:hypothetical protein Nmel_003923 [Mimus melanotis]